MENSNINFSFYDNFKPEQIPNNIIINIFDNIENRLSEINSTT